MNNMQNISEIQAWNTLEYPLPIKQNVLDNKFRINVLGNAEPLPKELEEMVNKNWAEAAAKKPGLYEAPILFLSFPLVEDKTTGLVSVGTNIRGYRYTHAFNRNPDFHDMTEELAQNKLLSLSTFCYLVTKDNKALFGTKKNQRNQVSGFSGFPNLEEDHNKGDVSLDIHRTIENRLYPEIGELAQAIKKIGAVGITYVNTPALRGTDADFIVYLDTTADEAQKKFRESSQFARELYDVNFNPASLINFFEGIFSKGGQMSRYALGASYSVITTVFGPTHGRQLLEAVREQGITIATTNETRYFG